MTWGHIGLWVTSTGWIAAVIVMLGIVIRDVRRLHDNERRRR